MILENLHDLGNSMNIPSINPYLKPKHTKRKTPEELEYEHITYLIEDRDFQQPTISHLSKCNHIKLPIVCDKCISKDLNYNNEVDSDHSYTENVDHRCTANLSNLTVWGSDEYNLKPCIRYCKKERPNTVLDKKSKNYSSLENFKNIEHPKSAPLSKKQADKLNENNQNSRMLQTFSTKMKNQNNKNSNTASLRMNSSQNYESSYALRYKKLNVKAEKDDLKMSEGDIRYSYTKTGLEVKRLSSKNWLLMDIYTSDVCQDHNEKSYADWINRQKEDETKMKQKFPSQIYEKELKHILGRIQKGPMTHETWARQSYEILILKEKIKRAKKNEEELKNEKLRIIKEQEAINTFELWKINKEFSRSNN